MLTAQEAKSLSDKADNSDEIIKDILSKVRTNARLGLTEYNVHNFGMINSSNRDKIVAKLEKLGYSIKYENCFMVVTWK